MRGQAVKDAPAGKTIKITGTIQAASASGNNGELEITKDLTIKPNGSSATLDANNMSRIFKVTGGKFTLNNMTLKKGKAGTGNGGGIYSEGTLTLNNTTIESCGAKNGGGIFLTGSGTAGSTMTGGKVSYNLAKHTADAKGGGIYIQESASFTMQRGNINNNKVYTGSVEDGGGVYVRGQGRGSGTHASFTLNGGTIGDNYAGFGGGVMVIAGGSCTMKNGTITGNRAYQNGGAAEVHGVFTWEGGSITGNHVNTASGEIIHRDGGHFNNPHNYTAS